MLLKVSNLFKAVKGRPILNGINIEIGSGEIVGLLGPNGAGKTTCFYNICGLLRNDRGSIKFNNKEIRDWPMSKRAKIGIGYLPQERSVFSGLTASENIMAVLELVEPNENKRNIKLNSLLEQFSLKHVENILAKSLSGGESRRLEIARALASQPKLLLIDEPFAGVDPVAIGDLQRIMTSMSRDGIGVLITDHNVRDTLDIVDRAYIIFNGKVLVSGKSEEILKNEHVKKVYLGDKF